MSTLYTNGSLALFTARDIPPSYTPITAATHLLCVYLFMCVCVRVYLIFHVRFPSVGLAEREHKNGATRYRECNEACRHNPH